MIVGCCVHHVIDEPMPTPLQSGHAGRMENGNTCFFMAAPEKNAAHIERNSYLCLLIRETGHKGETEILDFPGCNNTVINS